MDKPSPISPAATEVAQLCWSDHQLIVEFDAPDIDLPTRIANAHKDARLMAAGWRVWRFPGEMVEHEPDALMTHLQRLLASAPGHGALR